MKKILLTLISILLITINIKVDAKTLEIDKTIRYTNATVFNQVKPTTDNGFIAVTFKRGNTVDGLIVKYDKDGNIEWEKIYDKGGYEYFEGVEETKDSYFVIGKTSTKIIVLKYDKMGNLLFEKEYQITDKNYYNFKPIYKGYIIKNNNDEIIIGHEYQVLNQTCSYCEALDEYIRDIDGYILAKIDNDGNTEWVYRQEVQSKDFSEMSELLSINIGEDSNIYVTENYKYRDRYNRIILKKIDNNGNMINRVEKNDLCTSEDDSYVSTYFVNNNFYLHYGAIYYQNLIFEINNKKLEKIKSETETKYNNYFSNMIYGIVERNGNLLYAYNDYMIEKTFDGKTLSETKINLDTYPGRLEYINLFLTTDNKIALYGQENSYTNAFIKILKYKYDIKINPSVNGKIQVNEENGKVTITTIPESGYMVDEIIVKTLLGQEIIVSKTQENKYEFEITDDITIDVIFGKDYKIFVNKTEKGKVTSEKIELSKGRVNAVPDEGYEIDEIVIKDTTGKEVVYEEKDGYYYFDVNDDLVVTVTFKELPKEVVKDEEEDKEEENPKTADAFIYYACATVCSLFGIWSVEQYKKTRES